MYTCDSLKSPLDASTLCNLPDCSAVNLLNDGDDSLLPVWEGTIYLDTQLAMCSLMDFVLELLIIDAMLVQLMTKLMMM